MRSRFPRSALAGVLLLGASSAAAQVGDLDAPGVASLLVHVARFHDEVGGGPLDSCAVDRATGLSASELAALEPALTRALDEIGDPCGVPRHHVTGYNRGFLEAISVCEGLTGVRLSSWTSDVSTQWTLQFAGPSPDWALVSADRAAGIQILGREKDPPELMMQQLADALRQALGGEFRIDPRMAVFRSDSERFALVDLSEWEGAFDAYGATGPPGRFLERASCADSDRLRNHLALRVLPRPVGA